MSFLDELNGLLPNDPTKPLFEDLSEDELGQQQARVKALGQKILADEAVTGQRSPDRDALMIKAVDPYQFLVSRGHNVADLSTMDPAMVQKLMEAVHGDEAQLTGGVPAGPAVQYEEDEAVWPEVNMQAGQNGPTVGEVPIEEQIRILEEAVRSGDNPPDTSSFSLDGQQRDVLYDRKWKDMGTKEKLIYVGEQADDVLKQGASGAIGSAVAAPGSVLGLMTMPGRLFGVDTPSEAYFDQAAKAKSAVANLLGVSEKPTGLGYVSHTLGESVIPAGKATAAATFANTLGNLAINDFVTPAEAGRPPLSPEEKAARKAARDEAKAKLLQEQASVIVDTIGGPARIPASEYWSLAPIAIATAGGLFLPGVYKNIKAGFAYAAKPRQIDSSMPDLVALSRNTDLFRNADDASQGLINIARRAGIEPHVVDTIETKLRMQTRSAGKEFGNAAVQYGEANLPTFSFKSKHALADLSKLDQPDVRTYMKMRHDIDELLIRNDAWDESQKVLARKLAKKPNDPDLLAQVGAGKPGLKLPDGSELDLKTALKEMWEVEKNNPNLKVVSAAWQDILRAERRFMADGEYATLSKKELDRLNTTRPNEVPYGTAKAEEASPFELKKYDLTRHIQARLENEAKGIYVDEMIKAGMKLPNGQTFFKEITAEQLKDNKHWNEHLVEIYRRGEKHMYITDKYVADMLRMDVAASQGVTVSTLGLAKDLFQASTTGKLAPFFATTGMMRNYFQAKFTTPEGFKSPTILGTLSEVPRELYPKMATWIADRMTIGSQGWINQTLPDGVIKGLSLRLAKSYDDAMEHLANAEKNQQGWLGNINHVMDRAGSGRGSWLQGMKDAEAKISKTLKPNSPDHNIAMAMIDGYSNVMNAMHNSASVNFFRRNRGKVDDAELAMLARNLTGDSTRGGMFEIPTRSGFGQRPVHMEGTNRIGREAAYLWGGMNEVGRDVVPWFNIIQQSMKRTGQAYLENPAKFVGRGWLYSIMPASAEYLYTSSLGPEYRDYLMEQTPDGKRMMNWYIPIPGRPPAEGVWLPTFQEMSVHRYLTHNAWHHLTANAFFTEGDDFKRAASTFAGVAFGIPVPPGVNLSIASQGMNPVFNLLDESYKPRERPYDPDAGLPMGLEILGRAIFPSIADIVGSFAAGMMQTPEKWQPGDGVPKSFVNGFKDAGTRMVGKNPILRDLVDMAPPSPGVTPLSVNQRADEKTVNELVGFMRNFELGDLVRKNKERSKAGGYVAKGLRGGEDAMPLESAGYRNMKPPDNPLYNEFMSEVYARLKRDDPKRGGIGFQSLMERYRTTSAHLRDIKNVGAGNYVTWQQQMNSEARKPIKEWLGSKGIDTADRRAVENYLRYQQQLDLKTIINVTRHVEKSISDRAGREVKFKDLKPYL